MSVLVVTDSEPLRRLFANVMVDQGVGIVTAASTEEALAQLAAGISLAITDLDLADGSGLELVRALRESRPDLAIVCLSADANLLGEASRAGADAFLPKPLSTDHVMIVVRLLTL